MKILVAGATGSIGSAMTQSCLLYPSITQIITLTRRPLPPPSSPSPNASKLSNITIPDFGALSSVPEETWSHLTDADALIWAMGTYNFNADVNFNYPLAFQNELATRMQSQRSGKGDARKFKFILLGGAFCEPDQSRRLFFLWDQRRMKGLLQTKTLDFAKERSEWWEAVVVRPGGVMLGGDVLRNRVAQGLFGDGMMIRAEELGASVAELMVSGRGGVVENAELVEIGRKALSSAA